MNLRSSSSPLWRLELLGGLRARRLDLPDAAPLEKFRTQKTASLLAFLALSRRVHSREKLCELFWPDSDIENARNSLRVSLSHLRGLLEPPGVEVGSVLDTAGSSVTLRSGLVTDVELFLAALERAKQATNAAKQQEALEKAVSFYEGPLLHGTSPEWLVGEDGRLEDSYIEAVKVLTRLLEAQDQKVRALAIARGAIAAAPVNEEALQIALRLGSKTGQNDLVLRDFEAWSKRAKRRDFTISAETLELVHKLKTPGPKPTNRQPNNTTSAAEIEEAPPVAITMPRGRSLPSQWTKFFGRQSELSSLRGWLEEPATRLVTITGPGGGGKTRLALELGRLVKRNPEISTPEYSHFSLVEWVPLADLREAHHIPSTILNAIGQPRSDESFEMVLDELRQIIKDKPESRLLLIFDNFEHLCDEGGPLIFDLLEKIPELVCLVTSQRRLGFGGEREWQLQPLETPKSGSLEENEDLPDSVELFLNRARLVRQDFAITPSNRADVIELCARLDGFPLALELAAARVTLFSPAQILKELDSQLEKFPLDTSSASSLDWKNLDRTAPPRHRSLRAAIAWNQRQLPPAVARFWARLSIFRGGWTLDAAAEICDEPDAPPLMLALRDVSLISLDITGETPRGSQLEVLREYAAETLTADEKAALAQRHAQYFLKWAENVIPQLTGSRAPRNVALFEAELDNMRGALEWYLQHDVDGALRFASILWWGWQLRGHMTEGLLSISQTLDTAQRAFPQAEEEARQDLPGARERLRLIARTLNGAGKLATMVTDLEIARAYFEKSLEYYRLLGNENGIADGLYGIGYMHLKGGDTDLARSLCDESVRIFRELGEKQPLCDALYNRALVALYEADFEMVRQINTERLAILRASNEMHGVAISLENLGLASLFSGNTQEARTYFNEALPIFESMDETRSVMRVIWGLGHVARLAGQKQEALDAFTKALCMARDTQTMWTLPYFIEAFAYLALESQQMDRAIRLVSGAHLLRETYNEPLPGVIFQQEFNSVVDFLRQIVGPARFESEWLLGRTMSREVLVAFALNGNRPVS